MKRKFLWTGSYKKGNYTTATKTELQDKQDSVIHSVVLIVPVVLIILKNRFPSGSLCEKRLLSNEFGCVHPDESGC